MCFDLRKKFIVIFYAARWYYELYLPLMQEIVSTFEIIIYLDKET